MLVIVEFSRTRDRFGRGRGGLDTDVDAPMTARKGKKGAEMSILETLAVAAIAAIWSAFITVLVMKQLHRKEVKKLAVEAEQTIGERLRYELACRREDEAWERQRSLEIADHREAVISEYADEIRRLGGTPPEVRRGRFRREQQA